MWRQKASDVVFPDDVETIRRVPEQGCKQLQGFHCQTVLRELQTLSGHPDRLLTLPQCRLCLSPLGLQYFQCGDRNRFWL